MIDIENKIFNGSKIYDTNHIILVDFYVDHLNPVCFPSGLGNVSLILLTTHSCHAQLYPSTIGPVVYKPVNSEKN